MPALTKINEDFPLAFENLPVIVSSVKVLVADAEIVNVIVHFV